MIFKGAKMTILESIVAENDAGQILHIPNDMSNRDRRALAEWEAQGGVIEPYVAPPEPIPAEVSKVQFAVALFGAGVLTEAEAQAWAGAGTLPAVAEAAIDGSDLSAPEKAVAKIKAAGAQVIPRTGAGGELVAMMQAHLGMTNAQVDALFTAAAGM